MEEFYRSFLIIKKSFKENRGVNQTVEHNALEQCLMHPLYIFLEP